MGCVLGGAMFFLRTAPHPRGHEKSVGRFPLCLQGLFFLCFQAESLMEPNMIIIIMFSFRLRHTRGSFSKTASSLMGAKWIFAFPTPLLQVTGVQMGK